MDRNYHEINKDFKGIIRGLTGGPRYSRALAILHLSSLPVTTPCPINAG